MSVNYELVLGPSTLGINSKKKRVNKIILIASKEADATMFVSYTISKSGEYLSEKEITPNVALTKKRVVVPVMPGTPNGGYVYRIRIRGTGKARVHDCVVNVIPKG